MPAIGFVYPNGDKVTFEDVRKGNVDIVKMGMSLPTLIEMSKERDPNRKPSTTELLTGTCESYLKRKKEYYLPCATPNPTRMTKDLVAFNNVE